MTGLFCCKNTCTALGVIFSIIVGVVTTILVITAAVTVAPIFTIAALITAVAYLAVTLLASTALRVGPVDDCRCVALNTLLIAIFGTIISAIIILAVGFAATSIVGAIITGALLLFTTLILTSSACLVKQVTRCE